MNERGARPSEDIAETHLVDFARARFYNFTLRQVVPNYIQHREAQAADLSNDAQETLAASLRARLADARAYAALGQIPEPDAVVSKLLEHVLEQASRGRSSVGYLPKHKQHVEALLAEIESGAVSVSAKVEAAELERYRSLLQEDMRTLEYFGRLMD